MTLLAKRPTGVMARTSFGVPVDIKTIDLSSYEEFAGRLRFTRDLCESLERQGHLNERYELLDGEIILKVGQGLAHSITLSEIVFYLMGIWGPKQVFNQTTMEVATADKPVNRPEPDVYVLARPSSEFRQMPSGDETLLAVEVAVTSLRSDLVKKSLLYARAGVPEFWIIDVNGRKLYVHRAEADGIYTNVMVVAEEEAIAPLAAPDRVIQVRELLPPLAAAD